MPEETHRDHMEETLWDRMGGNAWDHGGSCWTTPEENMGGTCLEKHRTIRRKHTVPPEEACLGCPWRSLGPPEAAWDRAGGLGLHGGNAWDRAGGNAWDYGETPGTAHRRNIAWDHAGGGS